MIEIEKPTTSIERETLIAKNRKAVVLTTYVLVKSKNIRLCEFTQNIQM